MVLIEYAVLVIIIAVWLAAVHVLSRIAVAQRFILSFGGADKRNNAWKFLPYRKEYIRVFLVWLAAYLISGAIYLWFAKPVPFNVGTYMLVPLVIIMIAELLDPMLTRSYPAVLAKAGHWPLIIVASFAVEAVLINVVLYIVTSFAVVSIWIPFTAFLTICGALAVTAYGLMIEQFWVMKMSENYE